MILRLLQLLVIFLLPSIAIAQSLNIAVTQETQSNGSAAFSLADGVAVELESQKVRFMNSGNTAHFSEIGISPDRSVVSLLDNTQGKAEVTLLNARGDTLNRYTSIALGSNDPSLSVYPTDAGHVLLRNNIMNFTFHDQAGEIGTNISNGSQTDQGETISELVMNPGQETMIIYTSKIKKGDELGSKAQLISADKQLQRIYQRDDRYIKDLRVTNDGNLVTILTAAEGTSDQVVVLDKYGNEINTVTAEEELIGANASADGEHLTLFSDNRIRVYNLLNGENIGSTSLQQPVFMANYFSDDQILLILSGNYSAASGELNNMEVKAVDLNRRDIVSEPFSNALQFHEAFTPEINRVSANQYQLRGANKELNISVSF